jgi:uncharacterized repeat protein (TIGR03803 family)
MCGSSKAGTVFKLDTAGTETVLHSFTGGVDEGYPVFTSLILDTKGNLYGVTPGGNAGGLYKLSPSGTFTVLHAFTGRNDGELPYGTPVMDKQGNLYGTTYAGGSSSFGTVWKVSPKRKETLLHKFRRSDGINPYAGVVLDAEGNLYGTTQRAGPDSIYGTVYELNKKGVLTVLHTFDWTDGALPFGNLILDAAGNLYGTSMTGGIYGSECYLYKQKNGCGTVWKLKP